MRHRLPLHLELSEPNDDRNGSEEQVNDPLEVEPDERFEQLVTASQQVHLDRLSTIAAGLAANPDFTRRFVNDIDYEVCETAKGIYATLLASVVGT